MIIMHGLMANCQELLLTCTMPLLSDFPHNLSPTTVEVNAIARDVCVQDYSKTRAWILMKCCVSTGVGTRTNWLTFEPDPDHSPDAGTGFLSPIAYALQRGNVEFHYVGKIPCSYWYLGPSKQQRVDLRRRNTVVGGKCALPSALLVMLLIGVPCGSSLLSLVFRTAFTSLATNSLGNISVFFCIECTLCETTELMLYIFKNFLGHQKCSYILYLFTFILILLTAGLCLAVNSTARMQCRTLLQY